MVRLCKPIFLLNKRIRFCLGSNLFCALIPSVSVRAQWLLPSGRSPGLAVAVASQGLTHHSLSGTATSGSSLRGGISVALGCCAWPEAQYVFVAGVWQLCWKH